MRSRLFYLISFIFVLSLSFAARAEFDTVGVYDPTDEPHNNDVDQSGTFVSATGDAGPDNVIDLETFQVLIEPAFDNDAGGVVNGETPGTLDGEDIVANYGINQTKSLIITNNSGHIKSVGVGNLNRLPTSGNSGFGKDDDNDTLFTIGNINGGTPGEFVTHFGLTVLDRDDRTITPTVTAEFSDGSTVTSTATMDGSQPSNDQDTFFGFAAPIGTSIISVNFDLSNWSNMDDIGFITSVSVSQERAFRPNPANKAVDVFPDVVLSWIPGEFVDKHNVYLGTDFDDINDSDIDSPLLMSLEQDANSYNAGRIEWGQTYFWRVDEVNDIEPNSPWKGRIWSFTTANFIVVEDFENYNDFPPDEVWNTWIDGYGDPTNGSTAGYPDPDFNTGEHYLEGNIVNNGDWSMPLFYNNTAGLSEVTRTLNASERDWTREGVVSLALWYYGDAANVAETMYVALNGNAVVNNPDSNAALFTEWTPLSISLQDFADQGINLTNVNSMSIGFGNKAAPQAGGGSGYVFIDDIRLYRPE